MPQQTVLLPVDMGIDFRSDNELAGLALEGDRAAAATLQSRLDSNSQDLEDTFTQAAYVGSLQLLQWIKFQRPDAGWNKHTTNCMTSAGRLESLQWLCLQQPPCPIDPITCCFMAARQGHLAMLERLCQHYPASLQSENCQGHLVCGGHVEALNLLSRLVTCVRSEAMCAAAASSGSLDSLQWLRSQEIPYSWTAATCKSAAYKGHLHILDGCEASSRLAHGMQTLLKLLLLEAIWMFSNGC